MKCVIELELENMGIVWELIIRLEDVDFENAIVILPLFKEVITVSIENWGRMATLIGLTIQGSAMEEIDAFRYLKSCISNCGAIQTEISSDDTRDFYKGIWFCVVQKIKMKLS